MPNDALSGAEVEAPIVWCGPDRAPVACGASFPVLPRPLVEDEDTMLLFRASIY